MGRVLLVLFFFCFRVPRMSCMDSGPFLRVLGGGKGGCETGW